MAVDAFPRTVTIYGTGLIGSSLGLAFRKYLPDVHVYGVDAPEVLERAREIGAIEEGTVPAPDLSILAAPVRSILELLGSVPQAARLVMDVGSTKVQVCAKAAQLRLPFVGGHPMTGSERSGPEAASASMFHEALFFLCPVESTPSNAVEVLTPMIKAIGARPVVLDAEQHDRLVARTSHLPQLLSTLLASQTVNDRELTGPGWRSLTRLAASPFHVWRDILETSGSLPVELESFIQRLEHLLQALRANDMPAIESIFQKGNLAVAPEPFKPSDDPGN